MSRPLPRWTVLSLAATLLVAAYASAQEKDQAKKKGGRARREAATSVSPENQRASGVIVKVEPIRKGARSRSDDVEREKGQAPTHRLTINTAAVWRDWVRDQAGIDPNAPPSEAAKRGANSVATKGEPQTEGSLVMVDVGPNTKVETLFRESTDETTKGSKTPGEARAASEDPAQAKAEGDSSKRRERRAEEPRTKRYQVDDLQPGLFVEVDFRQQDARDRASTVAVIRPLGGPDDPDKTPGEEGKARSKTKAKAKGKAKKDG